MTEREIIKNLKSLSAIRPSDEFVSFSRSVVLSQQASIPVEITTSRTILSRGLNFAASVALAAVFMLVLTLGSVAGSFKTFLLPTLHVVNNDGLVSEANSVSKDIDIRLSDIEYFDQTKQTVALAEAPANEFATGENEIDKLLTEVIDY